jgi:hypothetical protein
MLCFSRLDCHSPQSFCGLVVGIRITYCAQYLFIQKKKETSEREFMLNSTHLVQQRSSKSVLCSRRGCFKLVDRVSRGTSTAVCGDQTNTSHVRPPCFLAFEKPASVVCVDPRERNNVAAPCTQDHLVFRLQLHTTPSPRHTFQVMQTVRLLPVKQNK